MRMKLLAVTAALFLCCAGCAGGTASGPTATVAPTSSTSVASPVASVSPAVTQLPSAPAAKDFVSALYGYAAAIPAGAEIAAATTSWDGGDVDHTAAYADRFYGDGWVIFTLGTPTDRPLEGFVDDHAAWLTASRGCAAPTTRAASEIDGVPAVRLAFHCPNGIYGPTLVAKAIAVRDGQGIIWTSMSPDTGADAFSTFDELLGSVRWIAP